MSQRNQLEKRPRVSVTTVQNEDENLRQLFSSHMHANTKTINRKDVSNVITHHQYENQIYDPRWEVEQKDDLLITPQGYKPSISIQSNEPDQIIEIPIIQPYEIQDQIVEKPEIVVKERIRERTIVKEVQKKVPRLCIIEREKIVEVPEIRKIQRIVHVAPPPIIRKVFTESSRIETHYVEKIMEEEQVIWDEKVVVIPKFVDKIHYVNKPKVVIVPKYRICKIPRIQKQQIEKIRYIPGPIVHKNIPIYRDTIYSQPNPPLIVEKWKLKDDLFVDKIISFPVSSNEMIPMFFEVPQTVHRIIPKYVEGKIIRKEVPVPIEQVVEVPVPTPEEKIRIIRREKLVPKEVIKEVEVIEDVNEIVEVPRYVFVEGPRTIIRPKYIKEIHRLPPIYLQLENNNTTPPCIPTQRNEQSESTPQLSHIQKPSVSLGNATSKRTSCISSAIIQQESEIADTSLACGSIIKSSGSLSHFSRARAPPYNRSNFTVEEPTQSSSILTMQLPIIPDKRLPPKMVYTKNKREDSEYPLTFNASKKKTFEQERIKNNPIPIHPQPFIPQHLSSSYQYAVPFASNISMPHSVPMSRPAKRNQKRHFLSPSFTRYSQSFPLPSVVRYNHGLINAQLSPVVVSRPPQQPPRNNNNQNLF